MRYSLWTFWLALLIVPAFSQAQTTRDSNQAQASALLAAADDSEQRKAIALLQRAEVETGVLQGQMRAWIWWQIGIAYQASSKAKALDLFEMALAAARSLQEDVSSAKPANSAMTWVMGRLFLTPGIQLQADIARSIVLLEPKRRDQVLQQIDPSARSTVLKSVLASQEKEKQFEGALETLNRITALDEMPYEYAMRLMDTLKPEQSAELRQLFLAALGSYRDHPSHSQFTDEFAVMLSRYWKRLPKEAVRQAIDEVLKQAAAAADQKGNYTIASSKGTTSFGSLYEYRLSEIMPVLREFDPRAARDYVEKYPALASFQAENDAPPSAASGALRLHPSSGYGGISSMGEMHSAQKAGAEADSGQFDEALADASALADVNLRAQAYELIARVSADKKASTTAEALEDMLQAAEKLPLREAFRYYSSAADIYVQIHDVDAAKKTIETGLETAHTLYLADSDDDDPNTALKIFWPSTNAYCTLLREAAQISPSWAISLLDDIKDPEVKVAAETALAGGWLKAPIGPSTVITTKKSSNSISFSGRE